MKKRNLSITPFDRARLEEMLAVVNGSNTRDRKDLDALAAEIQSGRIVDSRTIPPDVVTMNSRVRIRDMDTDEVMDYVLVFPEEADMDKGKMSVMSPIGTAILGYAAGDVIEWTVPDGVRRIKIEAVPYQPEAAGDDHL